MSTAPRNIVLVHGGFVDGSGGQAVYDLLTNNGHKVSIVQNPTLSLEGDADATRWALDAQDGPVVLVGHSYGGAVITEAGTHDKADERARPSVGARLFYVLHETVIASSPSSAADPYRQPESLGGPAKSASQLTSLAGTSRQM